MTWVSLFLQKKKTTSMKGLPNKMTLIVAMKARGRTIRDQPMVIWCITRITHSKFLGQSKQTF
jgi:hypothetical protein